jgi:alginate O-acetyltransferase complex protein AlgI
MIQNLDWWIFLLIAPVAYWLAPARLRPALLAIASFGVLIALAPAAVLPMAALGLGVYGTYELAERAPALAWAAEGSAVAQGFARVRGLGLPILVVALYLFWFKYVPPLARMVSPDLSLAGVAAPIGLSYFSFKLLHYAIERSRGGLKGHSLADYLSWLFLMPTFTAGPIERLDHYLANRSDEFRTAYLVEGGTRIAQGLVKKFCLSAGVLLLCNRVTGPDMVRFAHAGGGLHGAAEVWVLLILALVNLYLDFSAYSDIAIGASRVFGLTITENFKYPLLATNLTEFWGRWHMSLTGWCRAYIYMPLVGHTRNPPLAIIVTFAAVGLWHAGTIHWLAWGLWHGFGQAGVQLWARFAQKRRIKWFKTPAGRVAGWAMTLSYVAIGGTLVTYYPNGSLADSLRLMGRAFGI